MAAKRKFVWRERDNRLLQRMGIAAVELPPPVQYSPEAQAELLEAIREPIGQIGRHARIKQWLERTMRPDFLDPTRSFFSSAPLCSSIADPGRANAITL